MTDENTLPEPSEKLNTLIDFLETDPDNSVLLADTAELAIAEDRLDIAQDILKRYSNAELSPGEVQAQLISLTGLAMMKLKKFDLAAERFTVLLESDRVEPTVKFNLAWSRAMLKDFKGALEVLDEATVIALPQAAMLNLQVWHHLGEFDEAANRAKSYLQLHPDHQGLLAAISVLAMDVDDEALAQASASRAGNHPDALTTLGTLALGEDQNIKALELFDQALAINPHGPRTWIGKGLAQLMAGDTQNAAKNIDHGAEMFKTHLGSWIASGWAYFIMEDLKTSRQRFEHAMSIDDSFAEIHGSLAVLDVLAGDFEKASIGVKTAFRLDKQCFSAALAQTLILSCQGNVDAARKIFDRVINTPIDGSERTISQSLIRMGLNR